MSLLDEMKAEREANAAKASARLSRFLGGSSGATTPDNVELSQKVNHGRQLATADAKQKLSHSDNRCCQSATTYENQKLSQSGNHGCQPTADENPKPLHSEHYSAEPATAYEHQKLSHSGHNCAHPKTANQATRLPQNSQSRDGKRLARLLDHYKRGFGMRPATEQAVELTMAFGVSLRTAQRHIKRGTVPAKERRMGADGKHHPLSNIGRVPSKSERELKLARQALARAAHAAATDGIQGHERELLAQIQAMATEMQQGPRSQAPNEPEVSAKSGA